MVNDRFPASFPCSLALVLGLSLAPVIGASNPVKKGEMAGYLLVPHEKVLETYNAGFSIYAAAWPLLRAYRGNRFQTGLFGTWMFALYDGPAPAKMYSDIEGGLGWRRDTRFATETPKFIMGGVAPDFVEWANGPGAAEGRSWEEPRGKYGVAQLTPWLLWPPEGLNFKQDTCGELFGYGYLALPLTERKSTTADKNVPTGNHCWTLFLNTENFKGPVAFFTPYFWSHTTVTDPCLAGKLLDCRPAGPNRAMQMETQYVPSVQATDAKGVTYARIAPTSFPRGLQGDSVLLHHAAVYNKQALWDAVQAWFEGGAAASGAIDSAGTTMYTFPGKGGTTWRIYTSSVPKEQRADVAWSSFAAPMAPDPSSFGYDWNYELATRKYSKDGPLVTLPEYYRLASGDNNKAQWVPVQPEDVPAETGLAEVAFNRPVEGRREPYVTPDAPESSWKKPGPVAGPSYAHPGDGSVVTYYWYRFADQPALLNADLTAEERETLQTRAEELHRNWKKDRRGNWRERSDVWIWTTDGNRYGNLKPGYGGNKNQTEMGPELGFGWVMGEGFRDQVLLIKTCWGGRSLQKDFLPPSDERPTDEVLQKEFENQKKRKPNLTLDDVKNGYGKAYRDTISVAKEVLDHLATCLPKYETERGYELAGLVFFQGWNDMVNGSQRQEKYVNCTKRLAALVRDVRKDLQVPNLPVVTV